MDFSTQFHNMKCHLHKVKSRDREKQHHLPMRPLQFPAISVAQKFS